MKNIVWLVSYPKSGNTWFRMFIANYLKNADTPLTLEDIESTAISSSSIDFEETTGLDPFELTHEEVDIYRPTMYRTLSQLAENDGETLYKKTHDAYTFNTNKEPVFPEDISLKAVYFVRNPLDVCVSYANHSNKEIEKTVRFIGNKNGYIGGNKTGQIRQKLLSWSGHVQSWHKQDLIPTHFVRYEDMLMSPLKTFGSIIRFLDIEYEEERLTKAIGFSDFKLLQQMENENGFNEKNQKCKCFFWKGRIGNYCDLLTLEQINDIVEKNKESMKMFGYLDQSGILTI